MFYKLAWRNSKRSRNENLIYFFTMVIAAAAFYIILSLKEQDVIRFLGEIESDAVQRLLTNLMPTVYFCVLLFVFFLVVFANKYQLECRSRELGLYLMFGMTKKHLFIQIMVEGIITSFLALLGGLLSGTFLSEITSIATARLVGYGIIVHQSSFSISAVIFTILGFLLIQSIALFLLCGKLFRKELYQLLYGEIAKKHWNGNAYISFLSLILGIKYQKQGIKCRKNIVVGCIFIILFLLFGRLSLDFHLNCKATYQDLAHFQDIIGIEIPSSGKYRQLSSDTADTMDTADKIYIAKFKNDAQTKEFEYQLIQNENWVLSTDYSFSMINSLPIPLASEVSSSDNTYSLTYIEKENLYNTLPTPGEYRVSTCVYHIKNHYLMCGEYTYSSIS